ncbi:ABC transporter ATP-binding protein [Salinibius halmophilus]|uniref:ABC transporter ATP-binding protein n=1 Tax=Salinibius halmophilus TaxID=1853216 RepID=UPI000E6604A8|nr:ABC transporter ATP-binding protein [Salinibius halmophilus]
MLEAKGLSKTFNNKAVLQGVDLTLEPGQILGLLGVNGAGKTTLIHSLLGLQKPDTGTANAFGKPAWDMPNEHKQRIGFVAQSFDALPSMKVNRYLEFIGRYYPNWQTSTVETLLAKWQIDPKARLGKLSGGQKQRLAIICAVAHDPEVLVLDEPAASLDPAARRQLMADLADLNAESDKTILLSSHIVSDIERICSHVAILHHGKITYAGDIDELKASIVKLTITSQNILPESLPIAGIIRQQCHGKFAEVIVANGKELNTEALSQTLNAQITVTHLSLEDILLEVTK